MRENRRSESQTLTTETSALPWHSYCMTSEET